ncbi:MAG: hypothetical protein WA794_20160, partial [Trebonia sp.]
LYRNWVFGSPRGGGPPSETFPPATALPSTALPGTALPGTALSEALPETTPVDVINETTGSTR